MNIVAKKYASYVGNPKLMNNIMAEIQIAVPPTKEERDKISSYFESLDNLIALQQKEIDGYKELKKVSCKKCSVNSKFYTIENNKK